jgi:UDP-2,4-diacetamido-2,4,6-trideoxy-beta-L-altropyranose hydrolase
VSATPFVIFRADAGPAIGGGHVQRCLALADTFAELGWRCGFACRDGTIDTVPALKSSPHELLALHGTVENEVAELKALVPSPCDLLVVDHYGRDRAFETACRSFARRIVTLDDQPARTHDCDVLLDATPGRIAADYKRLVPAVCGFLLGAEYALLRRQFTRSRPSALDRRERQSAVEHLLVSIGTTDPQNLTAIVLKGIVESGLSLSVEVVLGSAALHLKAIRQLITTLDIDARLHVDVADMAQLMSEADLAIGACGSSSFERCCLGLPSLVVVAADNQRQYAAALVAAGAVESLGDGSELQATRVAAALRGIAADPERRLRMSQKGAALCDGRGALRVAIKLLAPEHARNGSDVTLRLAEASDRDPILAWQQYPDTRRFAHHPQPPTAAEHARWFVQTINDPSRMLLIVQIGGKPAGLLRLDREADNQFKISILTAPGSYRLGIGTAALALARRLLVSAELHAEVLPANEASRALFRKAGYREQKPGLFVNIRNEAMAVT